MMVHGFSALGLITVLAVVACYGAGVWGLYGHFVTQDRIEPGMKLTSLLSLVGMVWFLAARWRRDALMGSIGTGRDTAALCLLAVFAALFWWAVATTRRRRLTLAFSKDQPAFIHTAGPYAWIRHPFYTSYLIFWSAAAIASGSLAFWLIPLVMSAIYWRAIRIEETKFALSPMSTDYLAYKTRTGMLLPALPLPRRGAGHGV
jgi:protein-S-isoprenylcysteine O-methyltransferase Ste14